MSVPEAAIDKNDGAVLRKSKVRSSGKFVIMKPKPESPGMQALTDKQFGLRVTSADGRHIAAAGWWRMHVRHIAGLIHPSPGLEYQKDEGALFLRLR